MVVEKSKGTQGPMERKRGVKGMQEKDGKTKKKGLG